MLNKNLYIFCILFVEKFLGTWRFIEKNNRATVNDGLFATLLHAVLFATIARGDVNKCTLVGRRALITDYMSRTCVAVICLCLQINERTCIFTYVQQCYFNKYGFLSSNWDINVSINIDEIHILSERKGENGRGGERGREWKKREWKGEIRFHDF